MTKFMTMTFFAVLSISTLSQAAESSCETFDLDKKADQEIYQNLLQGRQVPNSTMSEETVRSLDLAAGSISSSAAFSYSVEFCNDKFGYKVRVD